MLTIRDNETLTDWVFRLQAGLGKFGRPEECGRCENEWPGVDNRGERCQRMAIVCDLDGIHYCQKCWEVEGL